MCSRIRLLHCALNIKDPSSPLKTELPQTSALSCLLSTLIPSKSFSCWMDLNIIYIPFLQAWRTSSFSIHLIQQICLYKSVDLRVSDLASLGTQFWISTPNWLWFLQFPWAQQELPPSSGGYSGLLLHSALHTGNSASPLSPTCKTYPLTPRSLTYVCFCLDGGNGLHPTSSLWLSNLWTRNQTWSLLWLPIKLRKCKLLSRNYTALDIVLCTCLWPLTPP